MAQLPLASAPRAPQAALKQGWLQRAQPVFPLPLQVLPLAALLPSLLLPRWWLVPGPSAHDEAAPHARSTGAQ